MIIPIFITHAGCPHQCVFCDQKNITGTTKPIDASSIPLVIIRYLQTYLRTVESLAVIPGLTRDPGVQNNSLESRLRGNDELTIDDIYSKDRPVQVAFYGGSFTALPIEDQISYLEAVQPFIRSGDIESIRLSTRPDAITPEILAMLKQYGVTTIELGAQSMDDKVLLLSGRGHSAADTVTAVALLREHRFFVGLQLMPGLPGDTPETFQETVSRIIALRPDFVRIYPALVIKDTPLAELYRTGKYSPLSLDDAILLCHQAVKRFEQAGIEVIRVGLQPTEELERPGTILAGPWHPAFRQLVESSRFLEKICSLLSAGDQTGTVTFAVNPADLSTAIGQKRRNIDSIKVRYGRNVKVLADARIPAGSVSRCIPAQDTL
jgi:histone acetyltransferase (RNA polymerase elongator complex component)